MSSYYRDDRERDRVYVRERSRSRSADRTPAFLREVHRPDAGQMVLRQREVETVSRPRRRSPSPGPVYVQRQQVARRARSVSPEPRRKERVLVYSSEKTGRRAPSPDRRGRSVSRVRTRLADMVRGRSSSSSSSSSFSSIYSSSRSPPPRRVRRRVSPDWKESERETERIHARIVRRRSPSPSPSPSPPPPPPQPQVIRGPVIEREVITHYTNVDHGVVVARPPSPQRPPRSKSRARQKETEIDIYTSPHETEVDIHQSTGRTRSRSRSHSHSRHRPRVYHDDHQLSSSDHLTVDYAHKTRRRAHSAAPTPVREEAERITSKIDSRGRMGEAFNGATREWTIVDVPPGTERIRMDGVGGGSADTTFERYTGVRRTKFIPERESGDIVRVPEPVSDGPRKSRDRLSISITDNTRDIDVKKSSDRRVVVRPQDPVMETWTEITMDLVNREAVRKMNYPYEVREPFIYITQYLSSREIDYLVELTDQIRRDRRLKRRQLRSEKEVDQVVIKTRTHRHKHRDHHPRPFAHEDPRYRREFY